MTAKSPALASTETPSNEGVILRLPGGIALRPFRLSDAKSFTRHANNRKIWDNLRNRMPHPYTEADGEWWANHNANPEVHVKSGAWTEATGSQGPAIPVNYAITINDEAVGSIGLEFGSDIYFRNAEIGYWLGEEHWGKGIMGAVVPAFIDWAWKTFDILIRLDGEVYEVNRGSQRCLEKAGFVREGRKINALVKNGKVLNSLIYGLLRPETEEGRA